MDLIFIADTSYSITQYLFNYLNAINTIIDIYRKNNPDSILNFATFNEDVNYVYTNQMIKYLEPITLNNYIIKGTTALYTSVINILSNLHGYTKPQIVVILTDGDDNTSMKGHDILLCDIIKNLKSRGWKFIFIGTTEKAISIGGMLGCQTNIMYDTTPSSLNNMAMIVGHILSEIQVKDTNSVYDVRDFSNVFGKMSI